MIAVLIEEISTNKKSVKPKVALDNGTTRFLMLLMEKENKMVEI